MFASTGLHLAGLGILAVYCLGSCSSATCDDKGNCAPPGVDGGDGRDGDADSGGPDAPAGCDPLADVKDAPKCVDDSFGVFVDGATGADSNAGTKASPVKTIGAALGKLAGKQRLYLCGEGPYAEPVKLTSAVSLYGGFACGGWGYNGTKAKLARTDEGYGLEVRGVPSAIVVSDLDVAAKDATAASGSSVAVFVASSNKVAFRRVAATAGKGKGGTDAIDQLPFGPASATKGNDGTTDPMSGAEKENGACPTSVGGKAGRSTAPNGADGVVGVNPAIPAFTFTGKGGMTGGPDCSDGAGLGKNGSYGPGGASGPGATKPGELTADGWKPADGAAGGTGTAGQGGGGGAFLTGSGVGGSGGPGGCGGAAGAAGTGGGASIAVLVFESAVLLEQSSLTAKDAGRGGKGAKGQKAQLGGGKGNGFNSGTLSCDGGPGGVGGSGGGGGGGAGGVSAGVFYKGTAPTVDGASTPSADALASVTLGQAGPKGTKGVGGDAAQAAPPSRAGTDGADGTDGVAKAVVSAP